MFDAKVSQPLNIDLYRLLQGIATYDGTSSGKFDFFKTRHPNEQNIGFSRTSRALSEATLKLDELSDLGIPGTRSNEYVYTIKVAQLDFEHAVLDLVKQLREDVQDRIQHGENVFDAGSKREFLTQFQAELAGLKKTGANVKSLIEASNLSGGRSSSLRNKLIPQINEYEAAFDAIVRDLERNLERDHASEEPELKHEANGSDLARTPLRAVPDLPDTPGVYDQDQDSSFRDPVIDRPLH